MASSFRAPIALVWVASSTALLAGCLVSFDGYTLDDSAASGGSATAGASGASGVGGAAGLGGMSGSAGEAGGPIGGSSGAGGQAGAAGMSGAAGQGGGSGMAGMAGQGGASGMAGMAGQGGASGMAGMAGQGGASGMAGMAGQGGASGMAGQAGAAGSAGSAGQGGGGMTGQCPVGLEGPPLAKIPDPNGGLGYCMDLTEVTQFQYDLFLQANVSPGSQPSSCSWNSTFVPSTGNGCSNFTYSPQADATKPVSCVDWCDARAYCAWAGKRLCGAIGGGAGTLAQFADAEKNEWYNACSRGGTQKFPYANNFDGQACVGLLTGVIGPQTVGSKGLCVGGYGGLVDMSGNVQEWENTCDGAAGATDKCAVRGGGYSSHTVAPNSLACDSGELNQAGSAYSLRRDRRQKDMGFRCCADTN